VDLPLRTLALLLVFSGPACVQKGEFECTTDEQCSPGVCGSRSFCAFADPGCPSGYRYGSYSAIGIAGTCTAGGPIDGGLGADAPLATADAPLGAADAPRGTADAPRGTTADAPRPTADAKPHPDAPPIIDAGALADAGPLAGCVQEIAAGFGFTCVLRADGALVCWGDDYNYQLGSPAGHYVSTPNVATGMNLPTGIQHITAGNRVTCLLDAAGAVWCLGDNYYHELGTSVPNPNKWQHVPLARAATQVSSSSETTCALLDDKTVECWGANDEGQLGDGTTNDHTTPFAVPGVANVAQVATGGDHACALITGGTVKCWGLDDRGQLGDGAALGSGTPKGPTTALATGAVELACGGPDTCIRDGLGQVWCWGDDNQNELGDTIGDNTSTPVQADIGPATSIALKEGSSCAILTDQTVWCWGSDVYGQIGDHQSVWYHSPAQSPLGPARAISVGPQHICALRTDGTLRCLGADTAGELGDGVLVNTASAQASLVTNATLLAAGTGNACVARSTGVTSCWGGDVYGELGFGLEQESSPSPVDVLGLMSPIGLSIGTQFSCAVSSAGGAACWGAGYSGQLGNGMSNNVDSPYFISAPVDANVIDVSASYTHACAAKSDGSLYCWGDNGSAQLGDGTMTSSSLPVQVTRLPGVLEVSAGSEATCARTATQVMCWGDNSFGQLGGSQATSTDLVQVPIDATHTRQLAAAGAFSCARLDTEIRCWGYNADGQLGNGTTSGGSTPVQVRIAATALVASDIAAHDWHACAVRASDGAVLCWGLNNYGQLGNGTFTSNSTPQVVSGLPAAAVQVAVGDAYSCARLTDGSIWCWGVNDRGQLGLGTNIYPLDPVSPSWTCP
jgi:alpha-tubulin suppressor-like RCC1 family protein